MCRVFFELENTNVNTFFCIWTSLYMSHIVHKRGETRRFPPVTASDLVPVLGNRDDTDKGKPPPRALNFTALFFFSFLLKES
jgi:hypothetical protein